MLGEELAQMVEIQQRKGKITLAMAQDYRVRSASKN